MTKEKKKTDSIVKPIQAERIGIGRKKKGKKEY